MQSTLRAYRNSVRIGIGIAFGIPASIILGWASDALRIDRTIQEVLVAVWGIAGLALAAWVAISVEGWLYRSCGSDRMHD